MYKTPESQCYSSACLSHTLATLTFGVERCKCTAAFVSVSWVHSDKKIKKCFVNFNFYYFNFDLFYLLNKTHLEKEGHLLQSQNSRKPRVKILIGLRSESTSSVV